MLKIKDNVDLKELKKFGFSRKEYANCCDSYVYYLDDFSTLNIDVATKDITIDVDCCGKYYETIFTLSVLYDLIQAGFVEKV